MLSKAEKQKLRNNSDLTCNANRQYRFKIRKKLKNLLSDLALLLKSDEFKEDIFEIKKFLLEKRVLDENMIIYLYPTSYDQRETNLIHRHYDIYETTRDILKRVLRFYNLPFEIQRKRFNLNVELGLDVHES